MIVEEYSAKLEYPRVGNAPLDADHHSVCKFASRTDPNFQKVKDTIINIFKNFSSIGMIASAVLNHIPNDGRV